jgi:hypothetical protein
MIPTRGDGHDGRIGEQLTAAGVPRTHSQPQLLQHQPFGDKQPVGIQPIQPHPGILLGPDPAAGVDDGPAQVVPKRAVIGDLPRLPVASPARLRQERGNPTTLLADVGVVPVLHRGTQRIPDRPTNQAAVHTIKDVYDHAANVRATRDDLMRRHTECAGQRSRDADRPWERPLAAQRASWEARRIWMLPSSGLLMGGEDLDVHRSTRIRGS